MTDARFREIQQMLEFWMKMNAETIEPVEVAQRCFAECRAALNEVVNATEYEPSWWRKLLRLP